MTVTRLPTGEAQSDRIFADTNSEITDFRFDKRTADVFDDMVDRSVPYYEEIQRMISEMAADFAEPGTVLYDLGCSTATTLLVLDKTVDPTVRFVGVDNSAEMLAKADAKLKARNLTRPYDLIEADLHAFNAIEDASVVTMVLTLMFIRPLQRQRFMERLYRGLRPGGCLLLVEKLTVADSALNRLFINYYYGLKRRNDYSEIEIARKRESLENVLIPYRFEENVDLLRSTGFRAVEEFFRWYNFGAIIAVK
jgi:tRNA (cmo5U34)-methyltransferase